MKKILNLILLLSLVIVLSNSAFSQDDDYYGNYEEQAKIKQLFLDIGYGTNGTGAGIGFRYSFFGFGLNLSGFAKDIPNYNTLGPRIKPEEVASTEKYPTIILSLDGYLFYDIDDYFTVFGNIGFYTQADSVLARKRDSENKLGDLYMYKTETTSGFSFGGGLQYLIWDNVGLGAGFHNKKGFFAQVSYYWF